MKNRMSFPAVGSKKWQRLLYGGIFLLLMTSMIIGGLNLFVNRTEILQLERAGDAVLMAKYKVERLIKDGASHLYSALKCTDHTHSVYDELVEVAQYNVFRWVKLTTPDGAVVECGDNKKSDAYMLWRCLYNEYDIETQMDFYSDGSLLITEKDKAGFSITGQMDRTKFERVFEELYGNNNRFGLYNYNTGRFFLNNTHYTQTNYYNALLDDKYTKGKEALLDTKTKAAQICYKEADGTKTFFAQDQTGIGKLGIVLIATDADIAVEYHENGTLLLIAFILSIAAMVGLVIVMIYPFSYGKNKIDEEEGERQNQTSLLELCASEGGKVCFIYDRKKDEFPYFHDGLGLETETLVLTKSLRSFLSDLKLEEAEIENTLNAISDIAGEETVAETLSTRLGILTMKMRLKENDLLEVCIGDSSETTAIRLQQDAEEAYFTRNKKKCILVWQVNLSEDKWRCEYHDGKAMHGFVAAQGHSWKSFSYSINNSIAELVHSADQKDHIEALDIDELRRRYTCGNREFMREYRIRDIEGDYIWHRQIVRLYKDARSKDLMARLYISNVEGEKQAEHERSESKRIMVNTLTALGGVYYGLLYIDLDNDICYTVKDPGNDMLTSKQGSYKMTMEGYIAKRVHPDDVQTLREITSASYLRSHMTENAHVVRKKYSRIHGDDYSKAVMIIQASRFENGTVRDVIIALRDYHDELNR